MEAQLQMREALKSQEKLMKPLPPLEDTRFVQIISLFYFEILPNTIWFFFNLTVFYSFVLKAKEVFGIRRGEKRVSEQVGAFL